MRSVRLVACLLVLFSAAATPGVAGLPVAFDSEWIRLEIIGDTLEVRGTYWVVCRDSPENGFPLFYPFPLDSAMGGARLLSADLCRSDGSREPISGHSAPTDLGVDWWLPPCTAGDTLRIESVYRQGLRERYARYVVTTTRAWRRPLRLARFEVRLPPGARSAEFSFPFEAREEAGSVWYAFTANDFFPDRDIIVRWKARPSN